MDMLARRVERATEEKVFPGCVIGLIRNGMREVHPFGALIYHSGESVAEDTVYDLASITKSIPTASLALQMIDGGMLSLNDKVIKYLPELHNDRAATIEDLMRYRVKGVRLSAFADSPPQGILKAVFSRGFDGPPGKPLYTNLPAFLLGLIIEKVAGARLDVLAEEAFFDPLGMMRTNFKPHMNDVAPTEIDRRGEVRGLPHDESAYIFAKAKYPVGHAGLFSTAGDLLLFAERLLHEPGNVIVRGAEAGLGWQVNDANFMGRFAREKTFGKTGFTGTSIVVDVERRTALVILSNRTYPKRPADDSAIFKFRRDIADIIFGPAQ